MDNKIRLKVIFVGSGQVGKTSLITQYLNKTFTEGYLITVGVDKSMKNIKIEGKDVTLEINDTAGQEDYRQVNKIFMKNTNIAIIVYDITNRASFEEIPKWIDTVKQSNPNNNIIFGLAANKSDLYENDKVGIEKGKICAKELDCIFKETTSTEYSGIELLINELVEKYIQIYTKKIENLKLNNKEKKKTKCC